MIITQTPQLREGFEGATIAEWSPGCIGAGVTIGTGLYGAQSAHLDYQTDETGVRWCRTQLTAVEECTKFLLAVWLKHTVAPAWAAVTTPHVLTVGESTGADFLSVRMAPSSGGMVLGSSDQTVSLTAPSVGVWEFWELRGILGTVWQFDLRRDGVPVAGITSTHYSTPVRVVSVGLGDETIVGTGLDVIEYDADRMWWWGGSTGDTSPEWWSATDSLNGMTALRVTGATLGPWPFTGRLGSPFVSSGDLGEGFTVHLLEGEAGYVPATITATAVLDAQPVVMGLAPRGDNPLVFETATWQGTASTTREARLPIGPLEATDPTANIYEVWAQVDGGMPFKLDGELIVT